MYAKIYVSHVMNIKQEHAQKTRQDLLDASLIVFSKNGYNQTRLEDIARQAGVTRGAFYWHFKNKTEIFSELQKQIMSDLFNTMKNSIDEMLSPLQNLRNVLQNLLIKLCKDENTQRCGKLFYSFENASDLKIVLINMKKQMEKTVYSFFSDLIDRGKKSGEIRDELTTNQIYLASAVTLKGTIVHIFDDISPFTERDIDSILNIFINGIKNKGNI